MKVTPRNDRNAPATRDRDVEGAKVGSVFSYLPPAIRAAGVYAGPVLNTKYCRGLVFIGQVMQSRGDEYRRANIARCRFWILDRDHRPEDPCDSESEGIRTGRDARTGAFWLFIPDARRLVLPQFIRVAWELMAGPAVIGGVTGLCVSPDTRPDEDYEIMRRAWMGSELLCPMPGAGYDAAGAAETADAANVAQVAADNETEADPVGAADGPGLDRRTDGEHTETDAGGRLRRGDGEPDSLLN